MGFQKATKKQSKARVALVGPSGSGKTYTALSIATAMGGRVAVIDTEHGSASKYADLFDFDSCELETFAPENYVLAIEEAAAEGYDVLIIDSLSHEWEGKGGALEMADNAGKRTGNSFTAWADVTPKHRRLVEAILAAPMHVIATMRAKTEYVIEKNSKGKSAPRKVGMAPVQRSGTEYEFDVTGVLSVDGNILHIDKTRCPVLQDRDFPRAGKDVADILMTWLGAGDAAPDPAAFVARFKKAKTMAEVTALGAEVKGFSSHYRAPDLDALRLAAKEAASRVAS